MGIFAFLSKWGLIAYFLSSLIPLSKSDHWFIRAWDFPRLQLLILGLLFGLTFMLISKEKNQVKIVILACFVVGISLDLYRVLPYSIIWKKESVQTKSENNMRSISILTVNVLQKNTNPSALLKLIDKHTPDMVFLLEVNKRWISDVISLEQFYPHKLIRPLENTYGLALYSKLELEDAEIRELIEKDIPSVYAKAKLRSGEKVELYGLHPRPPHYESGDTTERDAELIQVAKSVSKAELPVIVMGDLNDVAWSHTTRLFRRISKLLDPRVGRGNYPTFPTYVPFLRFPLDYVFHSDHLTLDSIKRLEDVGSDHYPMFIEFNLTPGKKDEQNAPPKKEGDEKEARRTIQRANGK